MAHQHLQIPTPYPHSLQSPNFMYKQPVIEERRYHYSDLSLRPVAKVQSPQNSVVFTSTQHCKVPQALHQVPLHA